MTFTGTHPSQQNQLLAGLSGIEFDRVLPDLQLVDFAVDQPLEETSGAAGYIYFPTTCLFWLSDQTSEGENTGLAVIGNDGLVGGEPAIGQAGGGSVLISCMAAGQAYRLSLDVFLWEMQQQGDLSRLVSCFNKVLLFQIMQTALCNQHHDIKHRITRLLLLALDRQSGTRIDLTHSQLGLLLGVRREAVSIAAGQIQHAGLISYRRGHIDVLDRSGLEHSACGCYRSINAEYERQHDLCAAGFATVVARPSPKSLHQRALAQYRSKPRPVFAGSKDMQRTLHELEVHHIELEMQFEELNNAYDTAEKLRSQLADVYDFSPVAYVTLDSSGVIRQINLSGAILLGVKRTQSARRRFVTFLEPASLAPFDAFLKKVLNSEDRQQCQVALRPNAQRRQAAVIIDAIADEDGQECRMVMVDVTQQRQIELQLRESEALNHAVINALTAHVAVIDEAGTILTINKAWTDFAASNDSQQLAMHSPGQSYRTACLSATGAFSAEALPAWQGIERVLTGTIDHFELDYPCDSPTESRWFRMSVYPLRGTHRGAVVAHENITAQKQAQLALRERDVYQRALIDNFPFMVWLKDRDSRFLAVNKPFAERFGWPSADALVGKTDFDIASRENAEIYRRDDRAVLDSGKSKVVEEWVEDHGQLRWVETYKAPVILDGQTIGTVGFARDISERKNFETALREQKDFFHVIAENIGDFIAVLDVNGRRIYNSPSYGRLFGKDHPLTGTDSFAEVLPADRQRIKKAFRKTVETGIGNQLEYRLQLADGSCRDMYSSASAIKDDAGKVIRVVVVSNDVTERRAAEAEVMLQKNYLKAIFDAEPECVKIVSPEGHLLDMNPAGLAMLEVDGVADINTAGLLNFVEPGHRAAFMELHKNVIAGATGMLKFPVKGAKGTVRWLETHATPLRDERGQVINLLGITRDITQQMKHETDLVHVAEHDGLTELPNRLLMTDRLIQATAQARRDNGMMALLFLDLDKFKPVNDTLGHATGDVLLREVAKRLQHCLKRQTETVARFGGDEFVILLPQIETENDASYVAKAVVKALTRPFNISRHKINISTSVGIAIFPTHGADAQALLKHADEAMYQAKDEGRGCFRFYSGRSQTAGTEESLRLKADQLLEQREDRLATTIPADAVRHELEVHRIELEMQREELRLANVALERARDRYLDLYEHAPVAYVSISTNGLIEEANLSTTGLLGIERAELIDTPFAKLVATEDQDRWYLHWRQQQESGEKSRIQLHLRRPDGDTIKVIIQCLVTKAEDKPKAMRITIAEV